MKSLMNYIDGVNNTFNFRILYRIFLQISGNAILETLAGLQNFLWAHASMPRKPHIALSCLCRP